MLRSSSISRYRPLILAHLGLLLIALMSFTPTLWCGFIDFDDPAYVLQNPLVCSGLGIANIHRILSSNVLGLWHPLSIMSLAIDYRVFGMTPSGYHLENLLLHALNGLLLLHLLWRLTGSTWRSLAVATLFTIHPLRVESVAWIAERKDVLSVLFLFLTLLAYERYCRKKDWLAFALMPVLLLLSMMAKPTFVMLPVLLVLLDFWPLERWHRALHKPSSDWRTLAKSIGLLLVEKIPVAIVSFGVSWYVLHGGGTIEGPSHNPAPLPIAFRLENAVLSCVRYIRMTVWFPDLGMFYPYPTDMVWPHWHVIGAAILLGGLTLAVVCLLRRSPHLFVGWIWYLVVLLPTLGVVTQISTYSHADRYTYVASIGLSVIFVWSIPEQWLQRHARFAYVAFGAMSLGLAAATWNQCTYWRNSITIFEHTLSVTSDNPRIQNLLGTVLAEQGRLVEAREHFAEALRIFPEYPTANLKMGRVFLALNQPAQALPYLQAALSLDPSLPDGHLHLGTAYALLGDSAAALPYHRKAAELMPANVEARLQLAATLADMQLPKQAAAEYQIALAIDPRNADAHFGYAEVLTSLDNPEAAAGHYAVAVRLAPSVDAYCRLAIALQKAGHADQARESVKTALQSFPGNKVLLRLAESLALRK